MKKLVEQGVELLFEYADGSRDRWSRIVETPPVDVTPFVRVVLADGTVYRAGWMLRPGTGQAERVAWRV